MNKKLETAFNEQINKELFSAYLYLSMASYFNSISLKGFESWMKVQVQEEMAHTMKFYDFIGQKGGKVILEIINRPENQWDSPLNVFEETLKHEELVTASIYNLMTKAKEEKDYSSETFLNWFVTEQVEEEDSAREILELLKLSGGSTESLFMIDKDLGQRIFQIPQSNT